MKMTDRIIEDINQVEYETVLAFKVHTKVRVKSSYESKNGVVTKAPHYIIDNISVHAECNLSGGWWIEIDGVTKSLLDYNIIKNKYNNHSISLI